MGAVGMTREWALDGNITSAGIVLLAYELLRMIAGLLVKDNWKLLVMNVIFGLIVVVLAVLVFANLALIGSCILAATDIAPKAAGMPVVALIGFLFAVSLGVFAVMKMSRKK